MKDKYIRQALRRMRLPKKQKTEIRRDLEEIFASAAEHGESEEQVIARLGTPEEYAAGVSGQLGGGRRSIFRIVLAGATGTAAACAIFLSVVMRTAEIVISEGEGATGSIGIIGGADGPTQIFVARPPQDPSAAFLWIGIALFAFALVQILLMLKKRK